MKTDPKTGRTTNEIFANAKELNDAIARIFPPSLGNSTKLHEALTSHGYTPTLRTDHLARKRSAAAVAERRDVLNLRAFLRAHGFSVFPETVPGES